MHQSRGNTFCRCYALRSCAKSIKNICKQYGIQTYFKSGKTLKNILVAAKDKNMVKQKSGVIYWFRCCRLDCEKEYIWKLTRIFSEKFKEHLKATSPIYKYQSSMGLSTSVEDFSTVSMERYNFTRIIKESFYAGVNNSILNRNIGKYNITHIWVTQFYLPPQNSRSRDSKNNRSSKHTISH